MLPLFFPLPKRLVFYVSFIPFFLIFVHQLISTKSLLKTVVQAEEESASARQHHQARECRFYLAKSAIPHAGLAVFTAVDLRKGEPTQSTPDLCIPVADTPMGTSLDTHAWFGEMGVGFEGAKPSALCEGATTIVNDRPGNPTSRYAPMNNPVQTNGGLQRTTSPGAGAIANYYGFSLAAARDVSAGSELTNDYLDGLKRRTATPSRSLEWLHEHGMCFDNIKTKPAATDPAMGRGAFANRRLKKGHAIVPAPLQIFPDRSWFAKQTPEALFVNYCFQLKGTKVLLYPYGQGVNLINHRNDNPNVGLRWSTWSMNNPEFLDVSLDEFLESYKPGALILEYYALRDIEEEEELFLDYGREWDDAWQHHVRTWKPVSGAETYVYPQDMNLSEPFRTTKEQQSKPYPKNLMMHCWLPDGVSAGSETKWSKPRVRWPWKTKGCTIQTREKKDHSYVYQVKSSRGHIYVNVPHSAISWTDKPYKSDIHLVNSFRHPIGFPQHLVPKQWKIN